ncbi:hypothetical protein CXG81DRAFT_16069 [Caulochytrium protostelioides]|uniref:FAD-binding FR-type domain-containing protein n=1 Tax=Caulochytrium protostelioides TaxID=1555241 RepID=A0A4P9X2F9_9FUNG|nr:hypothetical protein CAUPRSCDRAFT_7100 [Caulochytrium protostelioides]RKO98326.1 hypothetical protein CXG81DRAFT_16069 [Caulochytrium protostelioides]|eukprot:RKO98326.1 hypothetical protein CXG81DRAFT_16069 [Caulochytrium protostelioides]
MPSYHKTDWRVRLETWMVHNAPRVTIMTIWIVSQIVYFIYNLITIGNASNLVFARSIMGHSLLVSRSAANLINLNCGIILFTVCRNIITYLRRTILNRAIPFDSNIDFHICVGWAIVFWTYIHVCGHYVNYLNIANSISFKVTPMFIAWQTGPGATGQIMVVILFLMVTSAMNNVRRKYFEIFWFTHHLFVIFFGGILMHGSFCFIKADDVPNAVDRCRGGPQFWKFWVGSAVVYLIERMVREYRGRQITYISKVVQHPSKVVEVQIKKPSCKPLPGQYCFICCPEIALYEWHPFTLTSSPYEDFISMHIRVSGDWTTAFAKRLGCQFDKGDEQNSRVTSLPFVMIDGPYGTASEDSFKHEVAVLVAAGIGVTPFASILKTIWYRINHPTEQIRLRKVYFIWICRDKAAFEWFQDLLAVLEEESIDGFLEIHTYLTGGLKLEDVNNIMINDQAGQKDAITRLKSPTYFGRPNWDQLFRGWCADHSGSDVGVFLCGPLALANVVSAHCTKYSDGSADGVRFFFDKENF